ncbi:branched-chain amino acid ABC transporter permease [Demequina sp. NBRC 110053]|uniref:branched-chain amino acid ABC transporter permease n=1 Tax=Demequina sp. NBRC 110053 TaxID=1570342 RepID=UPI0009FE54C7|nr:branched-chain amino acid ABC transporter permease [Demequina sp. NBRC 110053]
MDILINALDQMLAPATAAFAIAAIGLNFHFGLTGLLNMGQAGFMLLGMYGYAISIREGLPMWAGILVAIGVAMVFGLLLGWPTLKLRGDYLAIVTIAAAEIVRYVGRSNSLIDITGGSLGIKGNDYKDPLESLSPFPDERITIGPLTYHGSASDSWWLRVVAWTLVAALLVIFWRLSNSPWGRVLKGIREDEDAVRALGKSVYWYKMQALIIGGVIGALGGIIWAHGSAVVADSMGRPTTFWIWTILLMGGAATVFGPVLGSVLFWSALSLVRAVSKAFIPESILPSTAIEPFGLMLVGTALILIVVFRPQGILGNKRELAFHA